MLLDADGSRRNGRSIQHKKGRPIRTRTSPSRVPPIFSYFRPILICLLHQMFNTKFWRRSWARMTFLRVARVWFGEQSSFRVRLQLCVGREPRMTPRRVRTPATSIKGHNPCWRFSFSSPIEHSSIRTIQQRNFTCGKPTNQHDLHSKKRYGQTLNSSLPLV